MRLRLGSWVRPGRFLRGGSDALTDGVLDGQLRGDACR